MDLLTILVEHHLVVAHPGEPFYFVEIGANDGVTCDPLRRLIAKHRLAGLMVEPHPGAFARLQENYRHWPSLEFENSAIDLADGKRNLYGFKEGQGLPGHANLLNSFWREALQYNGHGYRGEIEVLEVPTLSVTTLLRKHSISRVDLLLLDTESHDLAILEDWFRRTTIRPVIIQFERWLMDDDKLAEFLELAQPDGYHRLNMGNDLILHRELNMPTFED